MTFQVDAVFQGGVLRPLVPITLPEGSKVRVVVHGEESTSDPLAEVIGIGEGPESGNVSDLHDEYLTGER